MNELCPEVGIQEMLVLSFDGRGDGNMREHIVVVMKQRHVDAVGIQVPRSQDVPAFSGRRPQGG